MEKVLKIEEFEEEVPKKSKWAFGGLSFAEAIVNYLFFNNYTFYFNVKLGLSGFYVALAAIIFTIWNTINDPVFGYFEDKTKTRWGRRIPYFRFTAPFFTLFFILLWIPPGTLDTQASLFAYLIFILFLMDTFSSLIGVAIMSLPAEMAVSSKARGSLMVFGGFFNAFAQFISFAFPALFLPSEDLSTFVDPIFFITMIAFGILAGALLVWSSFHIKEYEYACHEETLGFIEGLKETFRNKNFIVFEIGNAFTWIAITMMTTGFFYYLQYVAGVEGFAAMIPVLAFFIMVFIGIPLFNLILKRKGVKSTFIISIITGGLATSLFMIIGWFYLSAIIGFGIIGFSISGYYLTWRLIVSDSIDHDELKTGKRREATYSGVNALITRPTYTLAGPLFLFVIEAFGFQTDKVIPSANLGIMLGMSIIPAICFVIGGLVMKWYKLAGPDWIAQKEQIKKIHEQKEAEYLKKLESENKI
jgi:GPH family glycoside/pentoside/hexuronide:cation symporter